MSRYKITSLNCIAAGKNRIFLNMDTQLDMQSNRLYDYVHLLAQEQKAREHADCVISDMLLEEGIGHYENTDYISKEFQLNDTVVHIGDSHTLSDVISAYNNIVTGSMSAYCREIGAICISLDGNLSDLISGATCIKDAFFKDMPEISGLAPVIDICNKFTEDYPYQLCCQARALSEERLPEHVLLNEQQRVFIEDKTQLDILNSPKTTRRWVRTYLSCCTIEERNRLRKFAESVVAYDKTYEMELYSSHDHSMNELNGEKTIMPLYEMDDICVKSKSKIWNDIVHDFDVDTPRKTEDVYLPDDALVISFCQLGSDAFLLTQAVKDQPSYLQTSLADERAFESSIYGISKYCTMKIESNGQTKTSFYPSLQQLSEKVGKDLSSYEEALELYDGKTEDFFNPTLSLTDIRYNYMAQVPMGTDITQELNDYRNGNIYAKIYNTKNMYDSSYSVNMPADKIIKSAREYSGVVQCGGRMYLKFYDSCSYNGKDGDRSPDLSEQQKSDAKLDDTSYTYQKIESFIPNEFASSAVHPTYFFSVNIEDIDLDEKQKDSVYLSELKKRLKLNIKNAIRDIARNVSPVQTQLFDVYFQKNP